MKLSLGVADLWQSGDHLGCPLEMALENWRQLDSVWSTVTVMAREKLQLKTDGLSLLRARDIDERLAGRSLGRRIGDDAFELLHSLVLDVRWANHHGGLEYIPDLKLEYAATGRRIDCWRCPSETARGFEIRMGTSEVPESGMDSCPWQVSAP